MARQKRFKVLKTAIKKYKADTSNPATPFGRFKVFDDGDPNFHPNQPERGKDRLWKGQPFGVGSAAKDYLLNRPSTRSMATNLNLTGLALTDLAITAFDGATDDVVNDPNFMAARAVIFSPATGGGTTNVPNSVVTGLAYKRKNGSTYTVPFCQDAGIPGPNEYDAMGYISDKVTDAGKSVTFKPERFYGKGG